MRLHFHAHDVYLEVLLEFEVLRDLTLFRIGVYLKTASGDTVFRSLIADWEPLREQMPGGHYRARLEVPADLLIQGNYRIRVHSSRFGIVDYLDAFNIEQTISVIAPAEYNRAHMLERVDFTLLLRAPWRVERAG